ncbi:MAG: DUF763 domain-containing protein [Thermoprotei archaeon]|nr:MAG: DUF763 domain-containing protein [Thermoprotei archaeon]
MSVAGLADLPLHWGHVPPWLASIMKKLAKAIVKIIVIDLGSEALLRRLSNPLWFQAFNNAIGMDWDSSGSTTVTTAILKEVLNDLNIDVRIAGGKGLLSRKTPQELLQYSEELGLSSSKVEELIKVSKLGAKADSVLLQDSFTLYHHVLVFDRSGRWVIIQQGMNTELRLARRYHLAWYVSSDITLEPHSGVVSDIRLTPLNLTHRDSASARGVIVDLVNERPEKVKRNIVLVNAILKGNKTLFGLKPLRPIDFKLPYYKPVKLTNGLLKILREAYEVKPRDVSELMLHTRVGPETLRALSLISELIYREPPSLKDPELVPFSPFKYAFAIGGKDGIPYPVKREVAEKVIQELEETIKSAELGSKERLLALRALRKLAPKDVGRY